MDGRWIDAGLDAGWTLLDNSMELEARRSSPDEAYDGNEDLDSQCGYLTPTRAQFRVGILVATECQDAPMDGSLCQHNNCFQT